jgi:hypothetical protein
MMMDFADQALIALEQMLERVAQVAAGLPRSVLGHEPLELRAALDIELARPEPIARVDRGLDEIGEL